MVEKHLSWVKNCQKEKCTDFSCIPSLGWVFYVIETVGAFPLRSNVMLYQNYASEQLW